MKGRPPRAALLTWHPLTLWTVGAASAGCVTVYFVWLAHLPQMDFEVYRSGSEHVLGNGLYSTAITVLGRHLLFTYPPFAAALFWPFSHLSTHAGQVVWDVVDLAGLAALTAVSIAASRGRRVRSPDWRTALILLVPIGLLLYPVRSDLALGQINVVLILMIVTDLTVGLSAHGRHLPKGLLVGVAAAVKLTPLVFIPYLMASRQWRAARNATAAFLVTTGAMFAVSPRASWLYFSKDAFDVERIGNPNGLGNQALRAALVRAHLSMAPPALDLVMATVLCLGVVVAAAAYRRSSPMLGMLMCAATGLMVSPISWIHHYVWIVPALIWLAVGIDRPRGGEWWALVGGLAFVVIPPLQASGDGALSFVRDNAYVVATLIFVTLVATMLWRRSRRVVGRALDAPRRGR